MILQVNGIDREVDDAYADDVLLWALRDGLGLTGELTGHQMDCARWPEHRRRIAEVLATRSRDEWAEKFAGTDACLPPVLGLGEAPVHPHLAGLGN